eukprot:5572610-Pyramimonas_sp.AAC.1
MKSVLWGRWWNHGAPSSLPIGWYGRQENANDMYDANVDGGRRRGGRRRDREDNAEGRGGRVRGRKRIDERGAN